MNLSIISRPQLFVVQLGSDGIDLTFEVCCRQTGQVVAAFHYWDAVAEAERNARRSATALDAFYRTGGLLHLTNFLDAHTRLQREFFASRLAGSLEPEPLDDPQQKFALPPDPEGMNDHRSQWADIAVRAFQMATGADDEDSLGDLLTDLMHWSDRNGFDFQAAFDRALSHYAEETANEAEDL